MKRTAFTIALCLLFGVAPIAGTNLLAFGSIEAASDQTSEQRPRDEDASETEVAMPCDSAATFLDFAVIETQKLQNAYLIIVARLGKGERTNLNQTRLANAEEYVLRRGTNFKYVLATGDRTSGLGRLEVYVEGRLYKIMPFERNAKGYCIPGREGW